jgi:hypothetical protein
VGEDYLQQAAEIYDVSTPDWPGDFDFYRALAIIPGHSFQHMLTPADQLACLLNIRRHLLPGGRLVVHLDHQDLDWLEALPAEAGASFETAERVIHLRTGQTVQAARSWAYERSTQTTSVITEWYIYDEGGGLVDHRERGLIKLHCVFCCEMEHVLARAGFTIEALYGDFLGAPLTDQSSEMVWVARCSET